MKLVNARKCPCGETVYFYDKDGKSVVKHDKPQCKTFKTKNEGSYRNWLHEADQT